MMGAVKNDINAKIRFVIIITIFCFYSVMMKIQQLTTTHERGSAQQILLLFVMALILVAMVMAVFGYKIGHKQGVRSANQVAQDDKGDEAVQISPVEMMNLKKQLETAVQERDISLSNNETLQEQYEILKTQNLQLEQLNALLLDNVAKEGGVPLKVLASEIVPMPDRTFEYRFDVAMIDKSGKAVRMTPKLTLLNATSMVQIPLKPASYDVQGVTRIRGRFVMPEGFEPKQIKIELAAGLERTEQLYNWHVGKVMSVKEDTGIDERPIAEN